jgi:hypothetical protein
MQHDTHAGSGGSQADQYTLTLNREQAKALARQRDTIVNAEPSLRDAFNQVEQWRGAGDEPTMAASSR